MDEEAQRPPKCQLTRCFCLTLQQGVIIIAALELITFVSLITYNGNMLAAAKGFFTPLLITNDLVDTIIHFGVAMLLVVGVWRERRQLVWAWIYTRVVVLLTDVFTVVVASAVNLSLAYVLFGCLLIPIYTCFIIVVRSYALELKARDKLEPLGSRTDGRYEADGSDMTT